MAAELAVEAIVPLRPGRVSRIQGALPPAPPWPLQARRVRTVLPGDKPGGPLAVLISMLILVFHEAKIPSWVSV